MAEQVYLDEVFLSLQGEAGEVGRAHLFLRLAGCPLRCRYCDTPRSWTRRPGWERHDAGGTVERPNPLSAEQLEEELHEVARSHGVEAEDLTLAVTGGEPLEQAEFLLAWLPRWSGRVLLETAGILADRLEKLLPLVDVISLDWKLPSTLREGEEFLAAADCAARLALSGGEGWIKMVVADDTPASEVDAALAELADCAPGCRVYLQPVTRFGKGPSAPPSERLLSWVLAHRELPLDLRVLPQVHPLLGAR